MGKTEIRLWSVPLEAHARLWCSRSLLYLSTLRGVEERNLHLPLIGVLCLTDLHLALTCTVCVSSVCFDWWHLIVIWRIVLCLGAFRASNHTKQFFFKYGANMLFAVKSSPSENKLTVMCQGFFCCCFLSKKKRICFHTFYFLSKSWACLLCGN